MVDDGKLMEGSTGLHAKRVVYGVAIYVGAGFIACEFAFFFACRPFTGYWAVPPSNRLFPHGLRK
jgi:hypothetical protein